MNMSFHLLNLKQKVFFKTKKVAAAIHNYCNIYIKHVLSLYIAY